MVQLCGIQGSDKRDGREEEQEEVGEEGNAFFKGRIPVFSLNLR